MAFGITGSCFVREESQPSNLHIALIIENHLLYLQYNIESTMQASSISIITTRDGLFHSLGGITRFKSPTILQL